MVNVPVLYNMYLQKENKPSDDGTNYESMLNLPNTYMLICIYTIRATINANDRTFIDAFTLWANGKEIY